MTVIFVFSVLYGGCCVRVYVSVEYSYMKRIVEHFADLVKYKYSGATDTTKKNK